MKLLTLNLHGPTEDAARKLHHIAHAVLAEGPQVIALQEVCQRSDAPPANAALLTGCTPLPQAVPVRADNPAAHIARLLREAGVPCGWTFLPVKRGHGCYDEGLALLAPRGRIRDVASACISRTRDYADWKTRHALVVRLSGRPDWLCCVHMGWWQDAQEPFEAQWAALRAFLAQRCGKAPVWLLGDFNAPAELRGEGYDMIAADGWHDAFRLAACREGAATIAGRADGWQTLPEGGWRIDHVWCSRAAGIASVRVVFDGRKYPVVSDHAGVLVETAPDESEEAQIHEEG